MYAVDGKLVYSVAEYRTKERYEFLDGRKRDDYKFTPYGEEAKHFHRETGICAGGGRLGGRAWQYTVAVLHRYSGLYKELYIYHLLAAEGDFL